MTTLRTEFEEISTDEDRSINVMVNPDLSDFFFWHFHPEYELVFIEGANGNRHVGEHISRYEESDLVLIGSNIPHLNFDYGVKTPYQKRVVHLRSDFPKNTIADVPEFSSIQKLFDHSRYGIAFGKATKQLVSERIKKLHTLNSFSQLTELLNILQVLSSASDQEKLHDYPVQNKSTLKDQDRLKRIHSFIDQNYQRKIGITEVAQLSNLTNEAFCRYFKNITKLTFTEFVNHYRIDKAKKLLLLDKNITETCFECGFESVSYFNRIFKKVTKENPLAFKKRHQTFMN